jgi:GMP synthase (glutamine-hydrolysing)
MRTGLYLIRGAWIALVFFTDRLYAIARCYGNLNMAGNDCESVRWQRSMSRHVNVIRHLAFEDLGSFAAVFEQRGYRIRYYQAGVDDLDDASLAGDDLLVVLGGPISVNDGELFPFIAQEVDLLRRRVAAGQPTLGICLGAQLIAVAAGAGVSPGPVKEIGWYDLHISEAGRQTALRHLDAGHCRMLHWHGETFSLPQGAVLLASSEACENQAFSLGNSVLALQFHPEVTGQALERWYIGHIVEIMAAGLSVPELRADAARFSGELVVQGQQFLVDWLDNIEGQT